MPRDGAIIFGNLLLLAARARTAGCTRTRNGSMSYAILRFAHFIGLTLMGAGLLGVFVTDLRSRQLRDLALFAEAVRRVRLPISGMLC